MTRWDAGAKYHRLPVLVFLVMLTSGCASLHYARTQTGELKGKLIVEWRKPDLFSFRPDPEQPLIFVRKTGEIVWPEEMLTDGGSTPRPLWVLKNFSPWGYGPAFVVHDWLFHMHQCRLRGYEKYSLEGAATVMSEVMKTMMESPGFDYGSKTAMYLIYEAVKSQPARDVWTNGVCRAAGPGTLTATPDAVFVVEFPPEIRRR